MSYWPPPPLAISDTISLDVPAYLALTLQPVACSNGFTHWGCGVALPGDQVQVALALADRGRHRGAGLGRRSGPLSPPPLPAATLLAEPPDDPHAAISTAADAAASSAPPRVHLPHACSS